MKATKSILAVSVVSALTAAAGAANATTWYVTMHADNFAAGLGADVIMDFAGTWDDLSNSGVWTGNSHGGPGAQFPLDLNYTQSFTMNKTTGSGNLPLLNVATCVDNTLGTIGGGCVPFGESFTGHLFNTVAPPQADPNVYKTKLPFTPVEGGVFTWTLQIVPITVACSECTPTYIPLPMTVTLLATPLPAAAWLFGSGLLGLVGAVRRRRAA